MASIKVAVRVRPFNQREKSMDAKCIIQMENNRTCIINSKVDGTCVENEEVGKDNVKDFFFDYCYWSCDESSPNYSGQDVVYSNLGTGVVNAADEGYNACIFAYGQTGSGKTHTMMGEAGNEGLIPRICENLFTQMQEKEDDGVSFRTEVSYLEIYNEKVRDLLRTHQQPKAGQAQHTLKVREHPKDGPYVQGLTKHLVSDYHAIETIMKQGNERRTTASTNMNDTSSRSHAIFTIRYTQAKFLHDMPSETTSKINLVDLAGSERANSTGATGLRLKEGANINKSLVTLGSVISSLAEASTKKSILFVPYRDSILTWLLKDSLGGNSKTIMIAAISPADVNYSETLSTLRYANRAKNIINKPTVNEDTNVKLIRDLRAEIDKLKSIIGQEVLSDADKAAARKLYENEERLGALTDKWKDRWKETQKIMQDRALAFQHRLDAGIRMESELPHLVALEDDLLSTGILLYHLKEGKTFVGTENSKTQPDIVVSGPGIQDEQCIIENNDGFVVLDPFPKALCLVNDEIIHKRTRLQQGDIVTLGKTAVFRFNHPKEAEELREKRKSVGQGFGNLSLSVKYQSETDLLKKMLSVERLKREEDLTKQLDESRMLLEKQKQKEEERRMEEARNEFARQIREESRRLQETRGELQGRLRARFQSALSPAEIRKHLAELECQHNDAEIKRKQREKELVDSINEKISLMEDQQSCLNDLLEKCKVIKEENKKNIEQEVKNHLILRSNETSILNNEIRAFIDNNPLDDNKISELNEIWDAESLKLMQQENTCDFLNNEIKECIFALEKKGNLSDEDKTSLEETKNQLLSKICVEQATLEELYQAKAKVLKKYEHSFLNRYQFLIWERKMLNDKILRKKNMAETELAVLKDVLAEAQSNLDDVKTNFFLVEAEENKKISSERYRVDQMKKTSIKKSIEDQRAFNEKVQQYRALLKKGQDRIDSKSAEIESMRKELTVAMQVKNDNPKIKADLQENLNSMIEDLHELEKNHVIIKSEEEKIIKNMLEELNNKKMENERDTKMSEKVLSELQNISHEKILSLKKQVDISENQVHNCDADILKCYEKLNEINKYNDESNAKLDTELLYVAYLVEKEIQGKEEFQDLLKSINTAKLKLEQANKSYTENIENIQNKTEVLWKPLVECRDQAQVVLEDLSCARNVAEITLAELKEQFSVERKIELEEIESLREKLRESSVELKHDSEYDSKLLSNNNLNASVISNGTDFNIEEILVKQKQQIEDEMYEKIITMEKVMQQELDELKKREMQLLACLQKDKDKLLGEKSFLEKNKDSTEEHFNEVTQLLKVKDDELKATRDTATREIEKLHNELANANNEIIILQEKLEKYYSTSSLTSPDYEEDELSDTEVSQLLIRVNESEGFDEEDELIARLRNSHPSPPPTPINRFLQSVNIYKMNQINATVPKFILRGIGKGSYHVFEVKLRIGDINWTVYRRYRQFRDLHRQTIRNHPIVGNLEFPSRRYFGNLSEDFVRVRRAQLEAYLIAFLAILSNDSTCRIYAITRRSLTKQDLAIFHPFFKEGIYERNKSQ